MHDRPDLPAYCARSGFDPDWWSLFATEDSGELTEENRFAISVCQSGVCPRSSAAAGVGAPCRRLLEAPESHRGTIVDGVPVFDRGVRSKVRSTVDPVCVICGESFTRVYSASMCSDACRLVYRGRLADERRRARLGGVVAA